MAIKKSGGKLAMDSVQERKRQTSQAKASAVGVSATKRNSSDPIAELRERFPVGGGTGKGTQTSRVTQELQQRFPIGGKQSGSDSAVASGVSGGQQKTVLPQRSGVVGMAQRGQQRMMATGQLIQDAKDARRQSWVGQDPTALETVYRDLTSSGQRRRSLDPTNDAEKISQQYGELTRAANAAEMSWRDAQYDELLTPEQRFEARKAYISAKRAMEEYAADPYETVQDNQEELDWLRKYIDSGDAAYYAMRQRGIDLDTMTPAEVVRYLDGEASQAGTQDLVNDYILHAAQNGGMLGAEEYRDLAAAQEQYEALQKRSTDAQRKALEDAVTLANLNRGGADNGVELNRAVTAYMQVAGISKEEAEKRVWQSADWTQYQTVRENQRDLYERSHDNGWSSVLSVAVQPIANLQAQGDILAGAATGQGARSYDAGVSLYQGNQTIRQSRADKWGEGALGETVGPWLYNAIMSTADSAVNMALTQGMMGAFSPATEAGAKMLSQTVSNLVMGSGAATGTYIESKQRGMSDSDALARSIISGAIEGYTEAVGGERIWGEISNDDPFWKALLKSALSEGTEEYASNELNRIFNRVLFPEGTTDEEKVTIITNLMGACGFYEAAGYDSKEAFYQAAMAAAGEDASAFLAGAFSGVLMTGPGRAGRAAYNAIDQRARTTERVDLGEIGSEEAETGEPGADPSVTTSGGDISLSQREPTGGGRAPAGAVQGGQPVEDRLLDRRFATSPAAPRNDMREAGNEETPHPSASPTTSPQGEGSEAVSAGEKVQAAIRESTGGRISNETADAIRDDPEAVAMLEQAAGRSIVSGRALEVREDIKKAAREAVQNGGFETMRFIERSGIGENGAALLREMRSGETETAKLFQSFDQLYSAVRSGDDARLDEALDREIQRGVLSGEEIERVVEAAEMDAQDASAIEKMETERAAEGVGPYMETGDEGNGLPRPSGPRNDMRETETEMRDEGTPHPSSDSRETPDDTFPSEGKAIVSETEDLSNGREEISLREGGQRDDGQGAGREAGELEGSAGEAQARGEGTRGRGAAAEAGRKVSPLTVGELISTQELGLNNGTNKKSLRRVTEGKTGSMERAERAAKARGKTVVWFTGGNLEMADGTNARATIDGDIIYARADHPRIDSEAFVGHELGHDRIDNGEVHVAEVVDALEERLGTEDLRAIIRMYADTYAGMTDNEAVEEMLCDAWGNLNTYRGALGRSAAAMDRFLAAAREIMGVETVENEELERLDRREARAADQNQANGVRETRGPTEDRQGNINAAQEDGEGARFSREVVVKRIAPGMSDEDRYNTLSDREITVHGKADYSKIANAERAAGQLINKARELRINERKKLFKKLGEEFGVFRLYSNKDVDLDFTFSRGNVAESSVKQDGERYEDFAKMLSCFDSVIDDAIGVEVHNRNSEGYKPDATLSNVYVLMSAYEDGDRIVPVKLEIKEFSGTKKNTLHVAVALQSIEKSEIVNTTNAIERNGQANVSPSLTYKIADIFEKINPEDVTFTKYLPSQFLKRGENIAQPSKNGNSQNTPTSRESDQLEKLAERNKELREELKELRKQNRKLGYENTRLRDEQMAQRTVKAEDADRMARKLLKQYGAKTDAREMGRLIKEVGDAMLQAPEGDSEAYTRRVEDRATEAARILCENAQELNEKGGEGFYDSLRSTLRASGKIFFPQAQRSDVTPDKADWISLQRSMAGTLRLSLSSDNAIGVDVLYQGLTDQFGDSLFPEEITHPADQLMWVKEILDSYRPVYENPFSYNMAEAIEYTKNQIITEILSGLEERSLGVNQVTDARVRQLEIRMQEQQRAAEMSLKEERRRREESVRTLENHYREMREKRWAQQTDSSIRNRVLKTAQRLKRLMKKTTSANRAVIQSLIGDLDTEARKLSGDQIQSLEELGRWYRKMLENPDFLPDPRTEAALRRLEMGHIDDMTLRECAELTDALLNIENEIRNSKKLIDSADARDIYAQGVEIMRDVENSKGSKAKGLGAVADKLIVTETLSPEREARRITGYSDSDPLYRAVQDLSEGQRKSMDYQRRASERFSKYTNDKAFMEEIQGKKAKLIEIQGIDPTQGPVTLRITKAMRMALYLHSKNNENLRHIAGGGVTIPDAALYKSGNAEAWARGSTIRLTPSQVAAICAGMSTKEKNFADAAFDYFNTMSKEAVNEVSEKLKGYSLAEVENYFPINTDKNFVGKDFEAIKFDGSIEGMGFLKERVNSNSPIMLEDMNAVLLRSIGQHAKYYGMAIPVRNFNKLWGVKKSSYDAKGNYIGAESSVRQAIQRKWGEAAPKYMEKMMSDLQNSRAQLSSWDKALAKARSNYAGAVLTTNLSVAMKQAASYPTAGAVVGYGPLAKALRYVTTGGKIDEALIAKYTPLYWYRAQGYSTQELGDITKRGMKLPKALNWIQGVDLATTKTLWKAAEYSVVRDAPALRPGTEEYYQRVAQVYNRIIEETQPTYTTMQRPQMLRSDSTLLQSLSMFKTQPFQNFNIVYDAAANLEAKARALKVENTAETQHAYEIAKRDLGRAISSQVLSAAVFAGMTAAWNAFRGKMTRYRDKDGERDLWAFLKRFGLDMLSSAAGTIPFGSDAWEFIESRITGGTYYGFNDVTSSAIDDLMGAMSSAEKALEDLIKAAVSGEEISWTDQRLKWDSILKATSKIAGIPFENVENIANAVIYQTTRWFSGEFVGGYQMLRFTTSPNTSAGRTKYFDNLYRAYRNDPKAFKELYGMMIESGDFDEDGIKSAMESRMKKNEGVSSVKELSKRFEAP